LFLGAKSGTSSHEKQHSRKQYDGNTSASFHSGIPLNQPKIEYGSLPTLRVG